MQLSDRVGRRMKLQDLHVLMAVVQTGSMGKAAQRLNITQPAISRSVAELEHALGVRLLDRHRQGVEPTEFGRALLDCGVAVFDDLRQGIKNIEFLVDPSAGEVRIGSIPPLGASFVSAVIDRLSRQYPRIVFHMLNAGTDMLHRDLHERNVDLLIARKLGSPADDREHFEFLFNDPYVVVAGEQHPLARRRSIGPGELSDARWVLPPPNSPPGLIAVEAFRLSGLEYPRVTVVASTPQVRTSLLATGRFLTIFSSSGLRFANQQPGLKVLPVKLRLGRASIGVVTLKNRTLSPTAKLFIERAREVAKALATKSNQEGRTRRPATNRR
jgi:DNA-binding transcriptional LysR family regulator